MFPDPRQNKLLASLLPEVQSRLFCHLKPVQMPSHATVYESGRAIHYVYFPLNAIFSMQYLMTNGDSSALVIIGCEGLLGSHLITGEESTPTRALVQMGGYAYQLPKQQLLEEFNRHGQLMILMLRYNQSLITQISQTAACNRHHSIEQQLSRWLLLCMDRVSHNQLNMTQESIADMLGVRREGVSGAAHKLQQSGVISYARGKITILDRPKLERQSCECYSAAKTETDRMLNYLRKRNPVPTRKVAVPANVITVSVVHARETEPSQVAHSKT